MYYLASHVYPCVADDHVVLLDLRRDKYVGIGAEQTAALAGKVKGWPQLPASEEKSGVPVGSVLAKMLAAGMLTLDPAGGKDAAPLRLELPQEALIEDELEVRPDVEFGHIVRFVRASLVTALEMKLKPLERVMNAIRSRRKKHLSSAPCGDARAVRRAVAAYIRLRPVLFGAKDACLFDSIALVRYLSYYDAWPACVIGVDPKPFAAHCWVQDGVVIFNDAPEYVRRYRPIFSA